MDAPESRCDRLKRENSDHVGLLENGVLREDVDGDPRALLVHILDLEAVAFDVVGERVGHPENHAEQRHLDVVHAIHCDSPGIGALARPRKLRCFAFGVVEAGAENVLHRADAGLKRRRVPTGDGVDATARSHPSARRFVEDRLFWRLEKNIAERSRASEGQKLANVGRIEHELGTLAEMSGLRLDRRFNRGIPHVGHITIVGIGEVEEDVVVQRGRLSLLLVSEDQIDPVAEERRCDGRFERLEVLRNERRRQIVDRNVVNRNVLLRVPKRYVILVQQKVGIEEPLRNQLFDFGRIFQARLCGDRSRIEEAIGNIEVAVLQQDVLLRERLFAQKVVQHAAQRRGVMRAVEIRRDLIVHSVQRR